MDGVLLVNLGTPSAPTPEAVRRYLAEFLADPRVVELPRFVWLPILHGIVLRTRPAKSAAKYAQIWTPEGSPLAVHTRRQAELLAARLPAAQVEYAMRYGEPTVAQALRRLDGCRHITVLPLYPQYSRSTTESVRDVLPAVPGARLSFIDSFHEHPAYISALAAQVRRHWAARGEPEVLLLSFHGLPQRSIARGDPYHAQCLRTAELLGLALGLAGDRLRTGFQSRFGAAKWLQPYTSDLLAMLGGQRCRRLDVLCPGFAADCLETLEEIAMEGRQTFLDAGGGEFHALPCLNEAPEWIDAMARILSTGKD